MTSTGILSTEHKGKLFITAFPENVAFYDPVSHGHTLVLTALLDNTVVTVTVESVVVWSRVLHAAAMRTVSLVASVELQRSALSQSSVVITSSKDIIVLSNSTRLSSTQTLVLQPVTGLGSLYYTPDLTPYGSSGNELEFKDFHGARGKIVIINSNINNVVKVSFPNQALEQEELEPFQVFQLNISDFQPVKIEAEQKVAVLLTHPCTKASFCTCKMMVIQLRPTNTWGTTFLLPDAFDNKTLTVTSDQSFTLKVQSQSNTKSPPPNSFSHFIHDLQSQHLNSSSNSSVMLIQPGHVTELVPDTLFASCLLTFNTPSKALVIVPDSKKNEVHLGEDPIGSGADWKLIDSLSYSWAEIDLSVVKNHVIWHPSTKIAVYIKDGEKWSEAVSLSTEPASQGCLLEQEFYIVDQSGTWAESISHCQDENAVLVSINSEDILQRLSKKLSNPTNEQDVWVGLRRRLVNGEWYWLNKQTMNITKWEKGQPGDSQEKFCASMSLSSPKAFSWKSRSCCDTMKPVCYKKEYFPL
ncbi:hypothetical protein ACEWY4_020201 [Coilia grayii]|uniref:C-type lectin domain-containing protein n=1 Tax=Coilia grayii TaxID=363190 RepID=A0ABD1JBX5_9TELE